MKNFRRICFALILSVVFTLPALGGDMHGADSHNPGDGHGPGSPIAGDTSEPVPGDGQYPTATRSGDGHSPGWLDIVLMMQDLVF